MSLPSHREHRTALVIDVRDDVTFDFEERYQRLLDSVGGVNIKVDVYTLGRHDDGGEYLRRGAPQVVSGSDSVVDLDAWAAGLGYTQLLVSRAPIDEDGLVWGDDDPEDDEE